MYEFFNVIFLSYQWLHIRILMSWGFFFPPLHKFASLGAEYLFENYMTCLKYKSHDLKNLMLTVHME